ncbi:MAG: AAA family ATPase, partial [Planctomycetes bacterium]|nr:AAA family ATPase [Planctomycetota bacterium]
MRGTFPDRGRSSGQRLCTIVGPRSPPSARETFPGRPSDSKSLGSLGKQTGSRPRVTDVAATEDRIREESAFLRDVIRSVESVIVGQKPLIDGLLIGLLADGHVLLEGVPGLAKSLAVQSLATALGGTFRRIQFTPDLLPSDLIGTQVY